MLRFLRHLTARSAYERRLEKDLRSTLKRVDRLEIALESLVDNMEHQKARLAKLGTRLGGALGGRPARGPVALQEAPERLEDIRPGDKAALRSWFSSRGRKNEEPQLPLEENDT